MAQTRPTGDQLRFNSSSNGEQILDTYLEAAEKGGRTLGDLLDDLFSSSGALNFNALKDFRGDWVTSTLYRDGDLYRDPSTKNIYLVLLDHTSGASIAADVSASKSEILIDVGTIITTATAAASSASSSASAAAASAAAAAASELALEGGLLAENNLSDLDDAAAARTNLGLEIGVDIPDFSSLSDNEARIAWLEQNLAINTLRDIIDRGWTIQDMVDGFSDAFTDKTGIVPTQYELGDDTTPTMTSMSAPSGTVTQSGSYGSAYDGWYLFNDTLDAEGWIIGTSSSGWVAYEFDDPVTIKGYSIRFGSADSLDRAPKDFQLEGWNGSSYDVLDTQTGETSWAHEEKRTYELSEAATYTKFRINVTDTNGSPYVSFSDLELLEAVEVDPQTGSSNVVYDATGDFFTNAETTTNHFSGATATATASYLTRTPDLGINENSGDYWQSNDGDNLSERFFVDMGSSQTINRLRSWWDGTSAGVKTADVYGSDTGSFGGEETLIGSVDFLLNDGSGYYDVDLDNATAYRHIMLTNMTSVNTANGNRPLIWDLRGLEVTKLDMTLPSIVVEAEDQPDAVMGIFVIDPDDTITLNTDLIAEFSRDGGTNWTAGTLTYEGPYDSTRNVYSTDAVDVSGQDADTSIRVRIRTDNEKEIEVHAWTVLWR